MAAKKTATTKKAATKAAEVVKETVKEAEVKVEAVEAEKVEKAPAKKAPAKKAAKKQEVYIQFAGREVLEQEILDKVKKAWTDMGKKVGEMADVKVYIKPEEAMAYYVINGDVTGSIEL